jgi:hypothetical protein
MHTTTTYSDSELVRRHAVDLYLGVARRRGDRTFSVNVGAVHKALGLSNRVPLVCAALTSKKFLVGNSLRLISKTGPPSGQSTTVTYTYEFVQTPPSLLQHNDPWIRLRGVLKDVYAEMGGGEAYLRHERDSFYPPRKRP